MPVLLSRRHVLKTAGALGVAAFLPSKLQAESRQPLASHGLSIFGDLKYPSDFAHFAYVDPGAPKGGILSQQLSATIGNQNFDTFNTLNIYVLKGDGAAGMDATFDSLMARALDEPDAMYGLCAKRVESSADGLTYRFTLRPEARFHDGTPLTAQDAAFSFLLLKTKGHPLVSQPLRFLETAEAEGDTVALRFAPERSRDLPLIVAGLPIFSKAYYSDHDFEAATLQAPLGSGPYELDRFEAGRFIAFKRRADDWAGDLPVRRGQNNFDILRYEYFRDREVAFEAFKGGAFQFREEFTARVWATGYDFPAVKEGRVKRMVLPDETPSGTQGWFFNLRREPFQDARIREAIGLAFDFSWVNATIMYGSYERTQSYFENSAMKASGAPSQEEIVLLEPFRASLPAAVFGEVVSPSVADGSGQDRALLRKASELLKESGCRPGAEGLLLPGGKPLRIEFLDFQAALQPHTQPFLKNLGLLGIEARSRIVDPAQYQRRMDGFDFDIASRRINMGATPGENLRQMFGSVAAKINGSANLPGIAHPAIDALLDRIAAVQSRAELTIACRALDRILRAGHYWVPMWFKASHWIAMWDVFERPAVKPAFDRGLQSWWHR